jgi:hypothetical protein
VARFLTPRSLPLHCRHCPIQQPAQPKHDSVCAFIVAIHVPGIHRLQEKMKRGSSCHEPQGERRDAVEPEPQYHNIDSAVNATMKKAKPDEDPRRSHVKGIRLTGRVKVQHQGVENGWQLKEVFKVVGGVCNLWR